MIYPSHVLDNSNILAMCVTYNITGAKIAEVLSQSLWKPSRCVNY